MSLEATNRSGRMGVVDGLASPFPLRTQVPSMLQEDAFLCRMLDGLDEVLAPALSVMDCFDSYLDPALAPIDMVRYVGSWVLATVDDPWNEDAVRREVAQASVRAKWSGTARALEDRLLPREVQSLSIVESGYAVAHSMSTDPQEWGDHRAPTVTLRVVPHEHSEEERARITHIARGLVPAHVGLTVDFER